MNFLGYHVKCSITGFRGIATSMFEALNGNIQYGVQPPVKEGETTMPDAINIDAVNLVVIGMAPTAKRTTPTHVNIPLGRTLRDKASGFKGMSVGRVTYLNGCVFYRVVQPVRPDALLTSLPAGDYIDAERVEDVTPKSKKELTVPLKPTGGPNTKAFRA